MGRLGQGRQGLGSLLGAFALVRVYSFFVDGPPRNPHAEIMWAAEAVGAVTHCMRVWEKHDATKLQGVTLLSRLALERKQAQEAAAGSETVEMLVELLKKVSAVKKTPKALLEGAKKALFMLTDKNKDLQTAAKESGAKAEWLRAPGSS